MNFYHQVTFSSSSQPLSSHSELNFTDFLGAIFSRFYQPIFYVHGNLQAYHDSIKTKYFNSLLENEDDPDEANEEEPLP